VWDRHRDRTVFSRVLLLVPRSQSHFSTRAAESSPVSQISADVDGPLRRRTQQLYPALTRPAKGLGDVNPFPDVKASSQRNEARLIPRGVEQSHSLPKKNAFFKTRDAESDAFGERTVRILNELQHVAIDKIDSPDRCVDSCESDKNTNQYRVTSREIADCKLASDRTCCFLNPPGTFISPTLKYIAERWALLPPHICEAILTLVETGSRRTAPVGGVR
jgi:hypothetical protein